MCDLWDVEPDLRTKFGESESVQSIYEFNKIIEGKIKSYLLSNGLSDAIMYDEGGDWDGYCGDLAFAADKLIPKLKAKGIFSEIAFI